MFAWLSGYARFDLPAQPEALPHLRAWLARLRARPSFRAGVGAVGVPFG